MPYRFGIGSVAKRRIAGNVSGVVIAVVCEDLDTNATSELTWFAPKDDFPAWPPTRAQVRQYIVNYLQNSEPGSSISRAESMRQDAAVIVDDPEIWADGQSELTGL
jgi:hypothetical protein